MRLFNTPAALRNPAGIHTPHSKSWLPLGKPAFFNCRRTNCMRRESASRHKSLGASAAGGERETTGAFSLLEVHLLNYLQGEL
ncbi:hypothetical protein [Kamptonema formosum]|uniref:hypothetical protein n=1 Tax=Kamptonema formosum TaxID=331992 RepID=UPI00034BA255|nr:hypothetical protein [Oscillatoria sp. PCC 10802]